MLREAYGDGRRTADERPRAEVGAEPGPHGPAGPCDAPDGGSPRRVTVSAHLAPAAGAAPPQSEQPALGCSQSVQRHAGRGTGRSSSALAGPGRHAPRRSSQHLMPEAVVALSPPSRRRCVRNQTPSPATTAVPVLLGGGVGAPAAMPALVDRGTSAASTATAVRRPGHPGGLCPDELTAPPAPAPGTRHTPWPDPCLPAAPAKPPLTAPPGRPADPQADWRGRARIWS